ncbi:MAG: recombinase family protein [Melioribacteraceae bacterium]|nr:recombinase family protein [Melioribacteraceae bacterium]
MLRILAKERNLNIVEEYIESKSAKEPGRLQFNRMLEDIRAGKADGIVCWKLDRLSRNPIDSGTLSWLLQTEIVKEIITFERVYRPEDNVLMMAVEQGMANQFIMDLRKNTKRGIQNKCERGWYPAQSPIGYMHNPIKKKGQKEIIPDPDRFDMVRKIFDLVLSRRYTVAQVLKIARDEWKLDNRHGCPLSRSTLYRILGDPFYYGKFEYPKNSGICYEGAHKPMITYSDYRAVQRILERRSTNAESTKEFTYRGIIRCKECGALITAEEKHKHQKNGNSHHYKYYHCTWKKDPDCSQKKSVEEKNIDVQIMNLLERIHLPQEFIVWAHDRLEELNTDEREKREAVFSNLKRQLTKIENRIEALIDLRLDSDLNQEDFKLKRNELNKAKMDIEDKIKGMHQQNGHSLAECDRHLDISHRVKSIFPEMSAEQKRQLMLILCSNLFLEDKKLLFELEKPFLIIDELAEINRVEDGKSRGFEPLQTPIKKGVNSDLYTENPLVLHE